MSEPAKRVEVEPLLCPNCQGAVPLGDGDSMRCPFCSATVAIPESYRAVRDSHRVAEADRARVQAAYDRLGAPPGALFRWWLGAARAAWWGLYVLSAFALIYYLLLADKLAGFAGRHAPGWGYDLVDVAGIWGFSAACALAFQLVLVLPLILGRYRHIAAELRARLGASMAAREPKSAGGLSGCRECGAPLAVAAGALGVRCSYCGTDNLVALPPAWVAQVKRLGALLHGDVEGLLWTEARELKTARGRRRKHFAWALAALVLTTAWWYRTISVGEHVPGSWRHAVAAAPRPITLYDNWTAGETLHSPGEAVVNLSCGFQIGFEKEICGVSFVVPLRKGESFALSAPDLPPNAILRALSGRGDVRPEVQRPSATSAVLVAPFSGWFRLTVGLPGAKPPLALHASVRVAGR